VDGVADVDEAIASIEASGADQNLRSLADQNLRSLIALFDTNWLIAVRSTIEFGLASRS
jgi:hypothetical protein